MAINENFLTPSYPLDTPFLTISTNVPTIDDNAHDACIFFSRAFAGSSHHHGVRLTVKNAYELIVLINSLFFVPTDFE